jgi:carotenoid cleavage dioxygenase-like enzyme
MKIDHCNNDKITRWEEDGVFASEPYFINDPTNEIEDGGLIVISVFDAKINSNRLVMIDTQTMKP